MQGDDPILLFTAFRDWFNNLKPLYITLNSLSNKDKLSVIDRQNLLNLMKVASKSCQKLINFEEEIRYQFETLVNDVSTFKQKRFELSVEVDDLEIKKKEFASEHNFLKGSITESSNYLKDTIEKLQELNSKKTKLTEDIEQEKDEERQLEKSIEYKKALLREMDSIDYVANFLTDTQSRAHDDIDIAAQNEELFSKNLFLSSRLEIMEIILSMLDTLIPDLKQVWKLIREILESSDREIIDDKINTIGNLITHASETNSKQSDKEIKQQEEIQKEEIKQEEETEQKIEPTSEDDKFSADDIDPLSKKLAFLNLECKAREQKSNELLSKIELRNVALNKLEEYFETVKNDVTLLENKYNDITEKIKSLVLTNRNYEIFQTLIPLDEKFYFEEYHNKLFSFYDNEKNKVSKLVKKSYEKLKNHERLLSLKQKEFSIIEERTKQEFPNYELRIANLKLRLSNKDKEIESLNNSIKEYTEKLESIGSQLENHLENHKKVQDSFKYEKESLLQKIIDLEYENKTCIEDSNNLKTEHHNLKEDYENLTEECNNLKGENHNLTEECNNLKGENHNLNEERNYLKEYNHNLNEESNNLKGENYNLKEECNNLKEENHNLKENCDKLQKDIDNLKEDNDTFKQLLDESQTECGNYKSKINELENQILSEHDTTVQPANEISNAVEQSNDVNSNIADDQRDDDESDTVIVEKRENVLDIINLELDKVKSELSEQIQKRNDTEKALLEIEKINASLASQISKRDNLINEYEEEIKHLKEKLNELPETSL